MKSMNQCLESLEMSWFYGINGSEEDKKYIIFYRLLLNYQDAFIFKQVEKTKKIKQIIEQLANNKRFINVLNMFDESNKNYFNKKQKNNIKITMYKVMIDNNYDMYQGINNKRHASNREILVTRLFCYEDEILSNKKVKNSEIEMDILTFSRDVKYHNFLRDFKKINEIDFTPKDKIFTLINKDSDYQLVSETLVSGLLLTKEKFKNLILEGYLLNYNSLIELINNPQYQNSEKLINDCKIWLYALEHDILFDDEDDYYFPSEDHYNRNLDAVTEIHYLQTEFLFNQESLFLISKPVLLDLLKSLNFEKFKILKETISFLIK